MNFKPEEILSSAQINYTENLPISLYLNIHVNNYCNLNCEYCECPKVKIKKEINLKILEKILKDFEYLSFKYNLPLNISLLGGEIYIYDKIDALINIINSINLNSILILSNLTLPKKIIKYYNKKFSYIFTFHSTQMKDKIFIKNLEKILSSISSQNISIKLFSNNNLIENFCKENNIELFFGDVNFKKYNEIFNSKKNIIRKCYAINFNYFYNTLFLKHVCKEKILKISEIKNLDINKFIFLCNEPCVCSELEYCIKKDYKVIE